jgi:lipoyl(octanoyl) transferase
VLTIQFQGRVSYEEGLRLQEELCRAVREGREPDTLLLLEHEPVYTIGRTRDTSSLGAVDKLPHPTIVINRGGQATYHGPGQLTAYAILDLNRMERDLHLYLRFLEECVLRASMQFGVHGRRSEGLTGVWVGPRKMASLGVGVRQWTSMHGIGWNITPESLEGFLYITPCGIGGVEMTCLSKEAGRNISLQEAAEAFAALFRQAHAEIRAAESFSAAFSLPESG